MNPANVTDVRLVPLLPEQVDGAWGAVQQALTPVYPNLDETGWQALHAAVKRQALLVEFVVGSTPEGPKALAAGVLQPTLDSFTGEKVLHVLSLYGWRRMDAAQYKVAFEGLLKLAKGLGAKRVTALSDQPEVVALFREAQAQSQTHWTLEVH